MTTVNQLNEYNRYISNTRQPFVRRHNASCVYYGIRGNANSQYLWDKSCVLDGAGLGDTVIERTGVVWNGAGMGIPRLGPGYAMPLGEEVINPVGVLWNGAGLGMNQGSLTLLGASPAADAELAGRVLKTLLQYPQHATVVVAKTSTSGGGEIDGSAYVMIDRDTFAELRNAMAMTPGGTPIPRPLTGTLAEFLVDGDSQIGTVASFSKILAVAENDMRRRAGVAPIYRSSGMPTKTKVLLGVGIVAIVGAVAAISLSRPHTSLNGARGRRRRRRKS